MRLRNRRCHCEADLGAVEVQMRLDRPSSATRCRMFLSAIEYLTDATQRTVLFWDVMRQRGNQYREHLAETAPNVLDYARRTDRRRPHARTTG